LIGKNNAITALMVGSKQRLALANAGSATTQYETGQRFPPIEEFLQQAEPAL